MVRNAGPALGKFGNLFGTLVAGVDMWMRYLKIGLPFTFRNKADNTKIWRKEHCPKIVYPKPDGVISFDRLSSVFISGTNHEEDQPVHLHPQGSGRFQSPITCRSMTSLRNATAPPAFMRCVGEDVWRTAFPDQCAKLRSLQNVRHQRPDPEHQLGDAGRRRWASLSQYVSGCAQLLK